jgi:hypothetical protein
MTSPTPTTCVVFRSEIFRRGIAECLERDGMRVLAVNGQDGPVVEAARTPRADVIVVEEPQGVAGRLPMPVEALLDMAAAGRVVILSLAHDMAVVYTRHAFRAAALKEIIEAVRGREADCNPRDRRGDPKDAAAPATATP